MKRRLMRIGMVAVGLVVACALAASGQVSANSTRSVAAGIPKPPRITQPPMADQTINGVPLRITSRDTGSVGVFYNGVGQFYSDYAEGVYIWANGQVWGPASVPLGPVVNPYSIVSNIVYGAGTRLSPWRIITTLQLGATGLTLSRNVRYTNGDLYTRQDFELRNNGTQSFNINLFHAADMNTAGEDIGYGFYSDLTRGIGGYNQARSFYQLIIPLNPNSRYKEDIWNNIWGAIGNTSGPGPGFDNTNRPNDLLDYGAGLQWQFSLGPGARYSIADFHSFTTATGCAPLYSDIFPSDYYFDAVSGLTCINAISGYSDGTFRPGNNTTRGQLAKIVTIAEGWPINTTGGPHFIDVPTSNPFYVYVETAYNRGVISGYSDGTFRPGADVTRGQLSKIIVTAEGWPINTIGGPHFFDVPTNNPFYPFVETAYSRGVISGYSDGTFRPNNSATRGQISKIVYSAITAP